MRPGALVFITCLGLATLAHAAVQVEGATETSGNMRNHTSQVIQVEGLPEQVIPLAGGQRAITFSFMAMDPNGWQDIVRAEVALFAPDNVTFLREANVTPVDGGNGASHWFNATFIMWYYEMPTAGENYTLRMRVLDQSGEWGRARYAEFQYAELSAIQITVGDTTTSETNETTLDGTNETSEPGLDFTGAEPGSSSAVTEVIIENTGNVAIDLEVYGTDLISADGHSIPVSAVRFSDAGPELTNATSLSLEPVVLAGFDLLPGEESARSIWWRLDVPTGEERYIPAGTYAGSITVNALAA